MVLKPVHIEVTEQTFIRKFSNRKFLVYMPTTVSNDPVILTAVEDEADTKSSDPMMMAVLRTSRGTDIFELPRSQIGTIFLMNESMSSMTEVDFKDIQDDLFAFSTEQTRLYTQMKVGVLLSIGDQTEEGMFGNHHATPLFKEFLDWIASPITLQGWEGFRGGLDVKNNTTGETTYYTELVVEDPEFSQTTKHPILFHVSTLLPHSPSDRQQLERKRHLGNDIVMIIFRENATAPFDPHSITSHFNFVFIIVSPVVDEANPNSATHYLVNVCIREQVAPFAPFLPDPPIFPRTEEAKQLLLFKIVNAERTALDAPDISEKLDRSRGASLAAIIKKHIVEVEQKPKKKKKSLRRSLGGTTGSKISKGISRAISAGT